MPGGVPLRVVGLGWVRVGVGGERCRGVLTVGVLVLSWYPPGVADNHGEPTEDLVPAVMDAAQRHSIKVTGEANLSLPVLSPFMFLLVWLLLLLLLLWLLFWSSFAS